MKPCWKQPGAQRLQVLVSRVVLVGLVSGLVACAGLPDKPVRAVLYDFGPGTTQQALPGPSTAWGGQALVLGDIEAPGAWDQTRMHYRLAYADARVLHAYAFGRWAMPPAQLLRQHLRAELARGRAVVAAVDAPALTAQAEHQGLRLEILEFSQVFDAPDRSAGLVRLQATALRLKAGAEQFQGQRVFEARAPSGSADAAGGAQALATAATLLARDLDAWLRSLP